jgi:hypothetical protein
MRLLEKVPPRNFGSSPVYCNHFSPDSGYRVKHESIVVDYKGHSTGKQPALIVSKG